MQLLSLKSLNVFRVVLGVTENKRYVTIADRFSIHRRTLERWVERHRQTGSAAAFDKGGGWYSPVDVDVMHAVVREQPDGTTEELTRVYNRRVPRARRVHRSSFLRALRRAGYVFKNVRGPQSRTEPTSTPLGTDSERG